MLQLGDINDLIDAVRSLGPNPVTEVLIPTLSGVVGVVAGFGLSTWKDAATRKRALKDARQIEIAAGRKPATTALIRNMEWAISNFQFDVMRATFPESIDGVAALFTATGEPEDLAVARMVRSVLESLSKRLLAAYRVSSYTQWWEFDDEDESKLLLLTADIAKDAKRWVDDEMSTANFTVALSVLAAHLVREAGRLSLPT
ncbi:hypothetical protein E3O55_08415 [Cryobacterium sp. MDB1-18-2]|uniref:hypothetical protein n=1 Tax=unclassified Cryobacterium TaxID=2649013 RepID=UPI00106A860B|nr:MULTISPECIES: hypothetical protein [unclassified Cryobacterium]TFC30099.1 hypothetical protein E3O55_08415 [Cryobacterium sp. MDB1-18-2]TFC41379.1 hypothetical protein E3O50_09855 [Cryobacterium sp. MDB1-18-1]